jgi:hypothetical protein
MWLNPYYNIEISYSKVLHKYSRTGLQRIFVRTFSGSPQI